MVIDVVPDRQSALARTSGPRLEPFGYVCHSCSRCCYRKGIQVNPYEVARLARNCALTTSEFRAAWTADGAGLFLAQTESGACVFLGIVAPDVVLNETQHDNTIGGTTGGGIASPGARLGGGIVAPDVVLNETQRGNTVGRGGVYGGGGNITLQAPGGGAGI